MNGNASPKSPCGTTINSRSPPENTASPWFFPPEAESFGKYEAPLAIDAYDGKSFALSAIALSDQVQPAAGLGGALEADLLSDRMPLLLKNMEVVPSAATISSDDSVALRSAL